MSKVGDRDDSAENLATLGPVDATSPMDEDNDSGRSHLRVEDQERSAIGRVSVKIVPGDSRLWSALLISLTTTLILGGGLAFHHYLEWHPEPSALPAVLVIVPGAFAAYMSAVGDHPLLQAVITGLRCRILASAVLSFCCRLQLSADPKLDGEIDLLGRLLIFVAGEHDPFRAHACVKALVVAVAHLPG